MQGSLPVMLVHSRGSPSMAAAPHSYLSKLPYLLAACALLPLSALAQLSFQSHQIVQSSSAPGVYAHADFNGDGREDLAVQGYVNGVLTNQLYASTGNGTYAAPLVLPASVDVIGDFNHDGKLDFASYRTPSHGVTVYLGNGDGTFQSGRSVTTAVPRILVGSDLNHDNKTDLITVTETSTNTGYLVTAQVWLSNGDGTFSQGQTLTTSNPDTSNSSVEITSALPGDFDGDGKADLALVYSFIGATTVQVFYGDGAGHLGTPSFLTDPNAYLDQGIITADVNADGRSDLIYVAGIPGPRYGDVTILPKLAIFTGNSNRTLSYTTLATNQCASALAVADFNGDGRNDIAYPESACDQSSSNTTLVVRPGAGGLTFGPEQTVYQNLSVIYGDSVLRSTTGTRPDLAFTQYNGSNVYSLVLLSNSSAGGFPGCGFSGAAEGISICSPPATSGSPVRFSIASAGPTPMRTAAVWVDGAKVAEQLTHAFSNYSFLDASVALSAGSHNVTLFGTGWDDTLQKRSFTLQVASSTTCSAPSTYGVHVCSPASGATVHSPVLAQATASISGTLARMEVWVDGVKKYSENTSTSLSTSISLAPGSHTFDFYAVNTAGTKWLTRVIATVN